MKGWILFIGFICVLAGYGLKSSILDLAGICLIFYGLLAGREKRNNMPIDIDITDCQQREIITILNTYPQGHLEIKFDRVFWCSDYAEPSIPRENLNLQPQMGRRPNGMQSAGARAQRAADVLGSMMGP